MTQAIPQGMTLEQFFDWDPGDERRYELIDGAIVEVQPTGLHEEIAGFLALELGIEIRRTGLPYFMPRDCVVKPVHTSRSGYRPDGIVLDRTAIAEEPLWEQRSTVTKGSSVRLVVEVVSTNWRDDYLKKLADYEALGIPEYWIVDYLALAASRYIGAPKQPTISVYVLVNGEYQVSQFRQGDRLISAGFPNLALTADQVFAAGLS